MQFLTKLKIIRSRLDNYNPKQRLREILENENTQFAILNLIRERIHQEGRLADGEKLITDSARYQPGQAAYSSRNTRKRNRSHVDLYETGSFFDGWQLRVGLNTTRLYSDFDEVFENFQDQFSNFRDMLDRLGTLKEDEIKSIRDRIVMPIIKEDLIKLFNV